MHREFRRANDLRVEAAVEAHLQNGENPCDFWYASSIRDWRALSLDRNIGQEEGTVGFVDTFHGTQVDELFSPESTEAAKQAMEG